MASSSGSCSGPIPMGTTNSCSTKLAAPTTLMTNYTNYKTFTLSEVEKLTYEVYRYSSYSPNFLPENILVDCPNDQTSRWSAYSNNPPQYLTLKLRRPAIVKKIKFGKFEKSHVCNIKKFRIYGGLDDESMVLLLESGLNNDNIPEVFNLRSLTEDGGENLPILFLKIVPLMSWGPSFNFSIWYIELHGQDDPMYTSARMQNYNMFREVEIVRLCLKHFRQQGYTAAYNALMEQTRVRLEHTKISQLHNHLVVDGDFEETENFLVKCIEDGWMDGYLNRQNYKHTWTLQLTDGDLKPSHRGGHQLVIDTKKRLIYLYGGWDGFQDMSDLWVYDIEKNSWTMLFANSDQFKGPTPRSCHKMLYDPVSENLFMLGRYLDNSIRTTDYIKSDFFLYDTRARTWLQICDDTSQVGGPQLLYDHQMCIDAENRTIYVFGGKVLTPRSVTATASNETEYSGLFSYHIATNTWTQILVDCHHPSASKSDVLSIKSRYTHCMVFHNKHRKLYIYGGLRGKDDIDDFLAYDVDKQTTTILNNANEARFEPSPGYTLRATIDCERDEIYIFSSLSKIKERRDTQNEDTANSFWVYSLRNNKWSRIYHCRHNAQDVTTINNFNVWGASKSNGTYEPCPRYAHQLIYDDVSKVHYLFGGNPGIYLSPQLRLNDFWKLHLEKPNREEISNHCRYIVRKLCYEEMVQQDTLKAMEYLRNNISELVDHKDDEQLNNFHKLASLLFKPGDSENQDESLMSLPLGIKHNNLGIDMKTSPFMAKENSQFENEQMVVDESNDSPHRSDNDSDMLAEDLSLESSDSDLATTLSGTGCLRSGAIRLKRARLNVNHPANNKRTFLFNKLVQLMPPNLVQPERNLSDFIVL